MASNYWCSSQRRRWTLTPEILEEKRAKLRVSFSEDQLDTIEELLLQLMVDVGKVLLWRAPVVATAKVLYKRFYIKASVESFDPRLIMVTSLYLAAKIEELGQYNLVRLLNAVSGTVRKQNIDFPSFSAQHVHDFEFHILEKLGFDLVMFNPYGYLTTYCTDARVPPDCFQCAWDITNDSYRSDTILLYPPYMIALAALWIACIHKKVEAQEWYNRLNIRLDELREVVRCIVESLKRREAQKQDAGYNHRRNEVLKIMNSKYRASFEHQTEEHRKRSKELESNKHKKAKKK